MLLSVSASRIALWRSIEVLLFLLVSAVVVVAMLDSPSHTHFIDLDKKKPSIKQSKRFSCFCFSLYF